MPAAPRPSRVRVALNVAEVVAVVLIALNLAPSVVSRYFPIDAPDDVRWTEMRSIEFPTGLATFNLTGRGPSRLEVNSEAFVIVSLDVEGLPLDTKLEVMFTPTAMGLNVQPTAPVRDTVSPYGIPPAKTFAVAQGVFLLSSSTPGSKVFTVETEVQGIADPGLTFPAVPMRVAVFQPTDWFQRAATIVNALGLPALIAAIGIEWWKRRQRHTPKTSR